MSRKKLAWANKEVETFVCILGEEDVVYDVYVAAAAIDIRPTTKEENYPQFYLNVSPCWLRRELSSVLSQRLPLLAENGNYHQFYLSDSPYWPRRGNNTSPT
ncbi:unnamed protein product [Boreogadus saida]